MMMRLAGLEVNECPKFLAPKGASDEHHSIYFPKHGLRIPFLLHGTISYIPTRLPTAEELEQEALPLTLDIDNWDPHSDDYDQQEALMTDYKGEIRDRHKPSYIISSVISKELDPFLLHHELQEKYHASTLNCEDDIAQYVEISCVNGMVTCNQNEEHKLPSHNVNVIKSGNKVSDLTPERLAKVFDISVDKARDTMRVVTRDCPRNTADITLNRRYGNNDCMLRYPKVMHVVYMDTMFAKKGKKGKNGKIYNSGKSVRGFTCAVVFATEFGWVGFTPLPHKSGQSQAKALKELFKTYGVPQKLVCDPAKEQISGECREVCNQANCKIGPLEKGIKATHAERAIKSLKDGIKHDLVISDAPAVLWCYCGERKQKIMNSTAKDNFYLKGEVPETKMTGQPTDISVLCEFEWYEWVKYRREGQQFPLPHERLGRCLGPATSMGSGMSQYILTDTGQVLPCQTVRRLTPSEINNPNEQRKRSEFDAFIRRKFGDSLNLPTDVPDVYDWTTYCDNDSGEAHEMPEADDFNDLETYINNEVLLPQNGEHLKAARVIGIAKDAKGNEIGKYDANPIKNTRVYQVMFPDGAVEQYAANIIAENLVGQCNPDGHRYLLLESIIESKVKGSKSTRGVELCVKWKDGTTSYVPLKDMKETYPIETAEYSKSMNLSQLPCFAWWVPYTLRKREQIVSAVSNHLLAQKTHKYGQELPGTVEQAYNIDKRNGNTKWRDAIAREMKNVRIAFKLLGPQDSTPPPVHEFVGTHLVFDVKMDGTAKARLVADGHKTRDPEGSTYAGVVSRESVRIAFLYAALNGLNVCAADIQNAYLTGPTTQKLWTKCGPEFGSDRGRIAIITRALYGNKKAGADFRNHLRDCMRHLGRIMSR